MHLSLKSFFTEYNSQLVIPRLTSFWNQARKKYLDLSWHYLQLLLYLTVYHVFFQSTPVPNTKSSSWFMSTSCNARLRFIISTAQLCWFKSIQKKTPDSLKTLGTYLDYCPSSLSENYNKPSSHLNCTFQQGSWYQNFPH